MNDILNRPIVLVLNRNWQAINVRTPQQAFVQMATDTASALDIEDAGMLKAGEENIDHVLPRSRGGKTTWENCVLAHREVNSRKADRLPEEVGLRLLKRPMTPCELPSTLFIRNTHRIPEWRHFLVE